MTLLYPSQPVPLYPRPSIDRPGVQPRPRGEILPLVEPDGRVYGQASRAWCHSGAKALHPVVHLHLIDHEGRIYLQKRSVVKDLFPGYWDTAVGGHVDYGEQVEEALFREADEELGLRAFNPIPLERYVWESDTDKELVFVYAVVGHPALHPDRSEVSKGQWWTVAELEQAMGQDKLTPNFEGEFRRIKDKLFALL